MRLKVRITRRLAEYVDAHGSIVSSPEFEDVQRSHYGEIKRRGGQLSSWIFDVARQLNDRVDHVELSATEAYVRQLRKTDFCTVS